MAIDKVWIQPDRVVAMDKITALARRTEVIFSPDQRFMVA